MIGIYDSGVGGLSVMRAVRDVLPSADIVYFGDTRHAPYGSKPSEEISKLTMDALTLLQKEGATKIISACNSVSVSLAVSLFDTFELDPRHVIEMVGPTVSYFRHAETKILLVATPATIRSGMYQNAFAMLRKEVDAIAIPELAAAVEVGESPVTIEKIIRTTLGELSTSYEVVILACTHYPLVMDVFRNIFGEDVLIFDPAHAVAERAEKEFWPQEVGDGTMRVLVSRASEPFGVYMKELFSNESYTVEVVD